MIWNPVPTELTTAATDGVLAILCVVALGMIRHRRTVDPWKVGLWNWLLGLLALASVLAPMMILFGLKFGIVTTMDGQSEAKDAIAGVAIVGLIGAFRCAKMAFDAGDRIDRDCSAHLQLLTGFGGCPPRIGKVLTTAM